MEIIADSAAINDEGERREGTHAAFKARGFDH